MGIKTLKKAIHESSESRGSNWKSQLGKKKSIAKKMKRGGSSYSPSEERRMNVYKEHLSEEAEYK